MKNSVKGALLSGLLFPGLGQIAMKRYKRGIVLVLAVLCSLSIIVVRAVQKALVILETIESQGVTIDLQTVSDAAARASTAFDSFIFNFFFVVIVFCWVIGAVDAYRIGKKKDRKEQAHSDI